MVLRPGNWAKNHLHQLPEGLLDEVVLRGRKRGSDVDDKIDAANHRGGPTAMVEMVTDDLSQSPLTPVPDHRVTNLFSDREPQTGFRGAGSENEDIEIR